MTVSSLPIDIIEPFLNAVRRFGSDEAIPAADDGNGAVPVAAR